MCLNWRHHIALIEQWNRTNLMLTTRMLRIMYGPNFPELKLPRESDQSFRLFLKSEIDAGKVVCLPDIVIQRYNSESDVCNSLKSCECKDC